MAVTIQLKDFDVKAFPVAADIVYLGDSANGFDEVQSTLGQVLRNAASVIGLSSGTTASYAGGGTTNAFVATGLTTASIVTASILSSTNAASIVKVVPSANTLTVDFSVDPGSATTVSWIATTTP